MEGCIGGNGIEKGPGEAKGGATCAWGGCEQCEPLAGPLLRRGRGRREASAARLRERRGWVLKHSF